MQDRLFNTEPPADELLDDPEYDPYEEVRAAAQRLADEYEIHEEAALDAVLASGSEAAARRMLQQRWWMGELELRNETEAA